LLLFLSVEGNNQLFMCGIAGMVDLAERRPVPGGVLRKMADAIYHRGPDEEGFLERPGLGLASRRLSIVGLKDGQQPIYNEDRSIAVVYNGEIFDYPEMRLDLEGRGHKFATHCDTELIPHLWEDHQEGMFELLRGQFALALWDQKRQRLVLGRDRFGICPLYWSRAHLDGGDWLMFASEIKGLLASGLIDPRPDPRGIDQVFNFFALPGPATCFQGIELLLPGHFLQVQLNEQGRPARLVNRTYWQIDFPDQGQEERGQDPKKLVDTFQEILMGSVERRLRADVPVVSYLSGGIDSSMVVALATHIRGQSIPTFTIRIMEPSLDETTNAAIVSRHVGANPVVVDVGDAEVLDTYPRLTWATEGPVVDTSSTALLLLAQEVHAHRYKVALTGEGSDEWLAGYSWYKIDKLISFLNMLPGLPLGQMGRRIHMKRLAANPESWDYMRRVEAANGGHHAFLNVYGLMSLSRLRFYSQDMQQKLANNIPYEALEPNLERCRRWHPLNRALYWGARIHMAGHLLTLKGDRIAMHSSVEIRYPFLDEKVFDFLARLHPSWKLHGFKDKYILRLLGERWLPRQIAWGPKGMFRAPFTSFFAKGVPPYVDQLLSPESLRKTGYFDVKAVDHWRKAFWDLRPNSHRRTSIEMGLVGVVATQLWHHIFIDDSLADIPGRWHGVEMLQPGVNGLHPRSAKHLV
jgi:asparagine synthase (glutamine-hydrolysing)